MCQQKLAFTIPPPPEDDWIPPPPPDNELVPPPPPDDPSEPSYPPPQPTYFETVQPLSYTEQYSFSYPGSNFQYYGQSSTEYPTPNVPVSHPPLYFEALPSTYPGAAPAVVNPVEPVVYYDLQDGVVLPAPVASGAQSSVSYSESGHEAFGSGQIRSVDSHAEAFSTLLSNTEVGVSAANGTAGKALVDVPLTVATIQAPVTVSVVDTASASSTANALSKSTATNAQSKGKVSNLTIVACTTSSYCCFDMILGVFTCLNVLYGLPFHIFCQKLVVASYNGKLSGKVHLMNSPFCILFSWLSELVSCNDF